MIALFIVLGVAVYACVVAAVAVIFVYVYTAFYFSQLIRYTLIFTRQYRKTTNEMDNYYAGQEAERMRWIRVSFFSALAIGVMALAFALLPNSLFGLCCAVACLVFYLYFTIRFINYVFVFQDIENVLKMENDEKTAVETRLIASLQTDILHPVDKRIEKHLNKWLAEKLFLQTGITIDNVAQQIGTNRRYLSEYLNTAKGISFRQYINELRLEEAKKLIQQNPELTFSEIAVKLGYSDKSTLIRQINRQTSVFPSVWKEKILNS